MCSFCFKAKHWGKQKQLPTKREIHWPSNDISVVISGQIIQRKSVWRTRQEDHTARYSMCASVAREADIEDAFCDWEETGIRPETVMPTFLRNPCLCNFGKMY